MPQPKTKAIAPVDELRGTLKTMEPQFKAVLPSNVPPEKFTRVVMTAIQLRPELVNVDRRSLFGELLRCATDGLIPDGREATINTYGSKARYLPMVAGILKKARNSGLIKHIDAIVVYENDFYEAWTDEKGPHFKHMRARGDRGSVRLTFAYATTQDGGLFHEEIDEKQMAAIEKISKAQTGPWKSDFKDEMRRKSAIRRLAKYRLPSSSDLEETIKRDDDLYDLPGKNPDDKPEPQKDTPSRLKGIIDADEVTDATVSTAAPEGTPDAGPVKTQEEPPI